MSKVYILYVIDFVLEAFFRFCFLFGFGSVFCFVGGGGRRRRGGGGRRRRKMTMIMKLLSQLLGKGNDEQKNNKGSQKITFYCE